MGNKHSSDRWPQSACSEDQTCLIFGKGGSYHIQPPVEGRAGKGHLTKDYEFRPIIRSAGADGNESCMLELGYAWQPKEPGAYFAQGSGLTHVDGVPPSITKLLLAAPFLYDGREDVLFAAGVHGKLNSSSLKGPTVLLLTALGALVVLRTSSKAGLGAGSVSCYFHVLHLEEVRCDKATECCMTFKRGPASAALVPEELADAVAGRLQLEMPQGAMAQLLAALQLAVAVAGRGGCAPAVLAEKALASAVWPSCYWEPPHAPPDGGFAVAFSAALVSLGMTVRLDKRRTLGPRYFDGAPLLCLDLKDLYPKSPEVFRAVAHALTASAHFRALRLQRRLEKGELLAYSRAIAAAPLMELDFAGAKLEAEDVGVLANALRSKSGLFSLDLSETKLAGQPAHELVGALEAALPAGHSLRCLRLAACGLSLEDEASAALLMLLGRHCSQLQVLDLSGNPLGGGQGRHPALAALSQLWASSALREVRFGGTGLPATVLLPRAGPLAQRATLSLDLSGCSFEEDMKSCAGVLGPVKDLSITARGTPTGAPALLAALLSAAGKGQPRGSVELDLRDAAVGKPTVALPPKLSARLSLTLGHSEAVARAPTTAASVEVLAGLLEALPALAPQRLVLRNAVLADKGELENVLFQLTQACYVKDDLTKFDAGPLERLLGKGAHAGLGWIVPTGGIESLLKNSHVPRVARALLRVLEAGLESLVVTGSAEKVAKDHKPPELTRGYLKSYTGLGSACLPVEGFVGGGPLLAVALHSLGTNTTLLELDLSHNFMGDALAVTLGSALRKNRTLRALNVDGNYITIAGWSAFRGCLYGNKKLVQFAFPAADVQWFGAFLGEKMAEQQKKVRESKFIIKAAYMCEKGRKTASVMLTQEREVKKITAAKIQLGALERTYKKLVELQKAIEEDVRRNRELAESQENRLKRARPLWANARACLARADKAKARRAELQAAERPALQQRRVDLWRTWRERMTKLGKQEPAKVAWFTTFQEGNAAGRREREGLSPEEAELLLTLVPQEMAAQLEPTVVKTKGTLAKERELAAKLEGVQVAVESELLALQEIVADPAWLQPTEGSGFEDVVKGMARFGVSAEPRVPTPHPSLVRGTSTLQAAPQVVEGQLVGVTPAAAPAGAGDAAPQSALAARQAALQYDMFRLHQQRAHQFQRSGVAGLGPSLLQRQSEEAAARRRREQDRRRGAAQDPYGYGYYGYPYGPYGYGYPYGYYGDPYGYYYPYYYDEPTSDGGWDGRDEDRRDEPGDRGDRGAGQDDPREHHEVPGGDGPGDHGHDAVLPEGFPGEFGDRDEPRDLDEPGDHEAHMYGGGEEPPLPDGGGEDPFPAAPPPCPLAPQQPSCSPPSRGSKPVDLSPLWWAEERAMGSWFGTLHEELPYVKERDVLASVVSAPMEEHVCLCTQCSVDRLPLLREQCLAWAPGTTSVALFLGDSDSRSAVMARLAEIAAATAARGGCLVASLLHALPPAERTTEATDYDRRYPVNALRNLAMEEASSDLVFVLDVDFVPSEGLHSALLACPFGLRAHLCAGPRALVVPALELPKGHEGALPRDYAALSVSGATAFHTNHFPKGHRATDFKRWAGLAETEGQWSYSVGYEEFYEPYVVLSRSRAPRFDERFRGYGLNKCSFLRHWHALGGRLEVLAKGSHFALARTHGRSESWKKVYGPEAHPREAVKLGMLWRIFLRGLPDYDATATRKAPRRAAPALELPAVLRTARCRASVVEEEEEAAAPLVVAA